MKMDRDGPDTLISARHCISHAGHFGGSPRGGLAGGGNLPTQYIPQRRRGCVISNPLVSTAYLPPWLGQLWPRQGWARRPLALPTQEERWTSSVLAHEVPPAAGELADWMAREPATLRLQQGRQGVDGKPSGVPDRDPAPTRQLGAVRGRGEEEEEEFRLSGGAAEQGLGAS